MIYLAALVPEVGWYPDASERCALQSWDGDAWAERVTVDGMPVIEL